VHKYKKYVIVAARVHPGESNSSFMMQGFLKFITGNTVEAQDLRRKAVFKVIPMSNPDGVIAGNYRTGLAGNDLNRQFITPNPKLHPTVCAIKRLVSDVIDQAKQAEPIGAFVDIHGHSRKKCVFMYGPSYPLHNDRYFKCRVFPKLLDDTSEEFRFYSCKFRIEQSKRKTARVVLFKEFGIMNCFTLEASFHGYIDKDRQTIEMTTESFEVVGKSLGTTFHKYFDIVDEDERQRRQTRLRLKAKKKKAKVIEITQFGEKPDRPSEDNFASDTGDESTSLNSQIKFRSLSN
jgi:cytosolic carboxypeptidase protein 2/3